MTSRRSASLCYTADNHCMRRSNCTNLSLFTVLLDRASWRGSRIQPLLCLVHPELDCLRILQQAKVYNCISNCVCSCSSGGVKFSSGSHVDVLPFATICLMGHNLCLLRDERRTPSPHRLFWLSQLETVVVWQTLLTNMPHFVDNPRFPLYPPIIPDFTDTFDPDSAYYTYLSLQSTSSGSASSSFFWTANMAPKGSRIAPETPQKRRPIIAVSFRPGRWTI